MSMTIAQAKSELMQIYGALSPDKQRAIDTLVKIEPKTGHWIENVPEYQNIDPPYICSECGHSNLIKTNYCEQCGCKMVEPQESEDNE